MEEKPENKMNSVINILFRCLYILYWLIIKGYECKHRQRKARQACERAVRTINKTFQETSSDYEMYRRIMGH